SRFHASWSSLSRQQLALQDGHGLAAQVRTFLVYTHSYHAASCRRLESKEFALAQLPSPVGPKATVGRSGHRVFVNSDARSEKTRSKVVGPIVQSSDDDASVRHRRQ